MKRGVEHKSIDLCDSCQFSMKIKGYGKEIKTCSRMDLGPGGGQNRIHFPVESCNQYELKGVLSRYELECMAIYIEKKKDAPGFRFTKRVDGREVEFT